MLFTDSIYCGGRSWKGDRCPLFVSATKWLACSTQIKERRAGSGCTFRGLPSCDRYGSDDGEADPSATLPTSVTVASDY